MLDHAGWHHNAERLRWRREGEIEETKNMLGDEGLEEGSFRERSERQCVYVVSEEPKKNAEL